MSVIFSNLVKMSQKNMQKQLTADVCSDISLTVLVLEDKYNQCNLFSERNLTLKKSCDIIS